jgi:hypothetical protein
VSDNSDNIWTLLSSLAWPGMIGIGAFTFKKQISSVFDELVKKFKSAREVKIGNFELKGIYFEPKGHSTISGNEKAQIKATKEDKETRERIYESSRFLMLSHKIRPSTLKGQEYDLSVFLVRKTRHGASTAQFSDVQSVEYYLGDFFGEGKFGSKFIVKDSKDGFAMKTSAYGPPLCKATINFNDGKSAVVSRFLDFEMGDVFES